DINYSKALMGIVMNGAYKVLCLKDARGSIIARSLLKLMWNEDEEKPVLFAENIYTKGLIVVDEIFQQAIMDYADFLKLDLYKISLKESSILIEEEIDNPFLIDSFLLSDEEEDLPGVCLLRSFYGNAPFEKPESLGHIVSNGEYEFRAQKVFPPEEE
ncbi:MAG TPA: hypothetical protein P5048_04925, partial [Chlamydiales bacterium]|nr:hypothetical protein [Chlamydiales bacterium]